MSNTKRPNLQRQHTRTTKQRKTSELDLGLTLRVDGVEYTVRQGDLNSLDVAALRRETGMSFRALMGTFAADPDVDLVAAFVWLARRIKGERQLEYAEVAEEIGYDLDLDVIEETEEESDPEA